MKWPLFCCLLLLLVTLTSADPSVMLSNLPIGSIPLPDFAFRMTVNSTKLSTERSTFKNHLEKVTENHLKEYLSDNSDFNKVVVQSVGLTASVARSNNPTSLTILEAVFLGGHVDIFGYNANDPDNSYESAFESLTHEALTSDYYWDLLHDFVEDPVLAEVQNVEITFIAGLDDLTGGDFATDEDSNDDSIAMAAILAVCITILVLSMVLLLFMGYQQYFVGEGTSCCSSSAKSDTTYEDDEDGDDDEEADGTFLGTMPPPKVKRPSSSRRKRTANAHASLSCCNANKLEVITEEDDFTNIPLGVEREDMETKHNTILI